MKPTRYLANILIAAATALLIAACGGGGESSTAPAAGVSITAANAEPIARAIIQSVNTATGLSSAAGVLNGVSVSTAPGGFDLQKFIVDQLGRISGPAAATASGSLTGVTIGPIVISCSTLGGTSGTVVQTEDRSDPTGYLAVDDSITLEFHSCTIYGIVLNGTLSMTITDITPLFDGTPPYTLGVTATLSSLSVNDGMVTTVGNGDMSILVDDDSLNSGDYALNLHINSLTASGGGVSESFTDYTVDLSSNGFSGDFSAYIEGTIASSLIGGSVSFVTTMPFTGNDNISNGDPSAGVLWITTSADSSQAWLIAMPNSAATINVDTDGDAVDSDGDGVIESGTLEATIPTYWTALQ